MNMGIIGQSYPKLTQLPNPLMMRFTLLDILSRPTERPTERPILAIRQHLLPTTIVLFLVCASELAAFTATLPDRRRSLVG